MYAPGKLAAVAAIALMPMSALAQTGTDSTTAQGTTGQETLPLDQDIRGTSETALQDTLYELQALQHKVHQYHWNVVGSDFYQLHEFYAELYDALFAYIDTTAERLRAIGVAADGRPSAIAGNVPDDFAEATTGEIQGTQSTSDLTQDYAMLSRRLYDRVDATADDAVTQDFLIGIAYTIDKHLWQLRAHTQ